MSEIHDLEERVRVLGQLTDFWNNKMVWALVLAAVAAVFVVWTTVMALRRSGQKDDVQSELIQAKDRQLASDLRDKDAKIAEAQRATAALEVEALSLRKDLLAVGARENLLHGDTRKKLVDTLGRFVGQNAEVRHGVNLSTMEVAGPDVMGLSRSLITILKDARWSVPPVPFMSYLQGPEGITVQIATEASPATIGAAKALIEAMQNVPLTVQGLIRGEMSSFPRYGKTLVLMPPTPGGFPPPTNETIIVVVLAHPQ